MNKRRAARFLATILMVATAACSQAGTIADVATKPVDRVDLQKAAFAARATYVGYLEVAVQITDMPRCERAPPPCVRQATVNTIRSAQRTAGAATKEAEDMARSQTSDPSVLALTVEAATRSATAFQSIVEANRKGS